MKKLSTMLFLLICFMPIFSYASKELMFVDDPLNNSIIPIEEAIIKSIDKYDITIGNEAILFSKLLNRNTISIIPEFHLYLLKDKGFHQYPIYDASLVFVINKSNVKESIIGFQDLLNNDYKVHIARPVSHLGKASLLGVQKILSKDEGDLKPALEFIEKLSSKGKLRKLDYYNLSDEKSLLFSMDHCDILIMWDYQAFTLKNKYKDKIDVIYPQEGSFTTRFYLVGKDYIPSEIVNYLGNTDGRSTLIENGFSLIDGTHSNQFVASGDYLPTKVEDASSYDNSKNYMYLKKIDALMANTPYEHYSIIYSIFLIALLFWYFSIDIRISPGEIRKNLKMIIQLLIFWLLIRIYKYASYNLNHCLIVWYMYYIPMIFIPTNLLRIAYQVNNDIPMPKLFSTSLMCLDLCLFLMVLTNNLHQWVFVFKGSYYRYFSPEYKYNIVYYIIVLYIVIKCILTIRHLTLSKENHPTVIRTLVIALIFVVTYTFGHYLKFKLFLFLNITLTYITLITVVTELLIQFILKEVDMFHRNVLLNNNLIYGIFDENGNNISLSKHALPWEKNMKQVIKSNRLNPLKNGFLIKNEILENIHGNHLSYDVIKTPYGYLFTGENIDDLIKLTNLLKIKKEEIDAQLKLLKNDFLIKEDFLVVQYTRKMIDDIDFNIKNKVDHIRHLIDKFYDHKDRTKEEVELIYLELRIYCEYIKSCSIYLVSDEIISTIDKAKVHDTINSMLNTLVPIGIEGYITISGEDKIPMGTILKLQNTLLKLLSSITDSQNGNIFIRLLNGDSPTFTIVYSPEDEDYISKISSRLSIIDDTMVITKESDSIIIKG